MGLWMRLRQNLSLKIISLIAAVLLYAYVQQERNPTIPRTVLADVVYRNLQDGYEVVTDTPKIPVTVTGPRPSVESLKDGDIKAYADLSAVANNQPGSPVRLIYEVPKTASDVVLDTRTDFIKVQVFKEKSRKVEVTAIYRKDAPPGLMYSDPIIHPSQVTIRGREDRVNRVDKVVANASPTEPKASIDGDFPLSARDNDNNPVEGIIIAPDTVHVTVSQVTEPFTKVVTVSLIIADQPMPPYRLGNYAITPNQVQIVGSPRRVNLISTIDTEEVSLRDLTSDKTLEVNLITPPDVAVRDMQGRAITHVTAHIPIYKAAPPSNPEPSGPGAPTKREGSSGP